ncbi:hypothetical protein WG66_010098 [Moniliophthora roreri]|nr:hypothetical protein WG66_010098 [Moniliophthora roreri]
MDKEPLVMTMSNPRGLDHALSKPVRSPLRQRCHYRPQGLSDVGEENQIEHKGSVGSIR